MTKGELFIDNLQSVVEGYGSEEIKLSIGDSINNNRVPTVNQVIRFLSTRRNKKLKSLGVSLESVYDIVRGDITNSRNNGRTDSVDVNEFINFYGTKLSRSKKFRNLVGRSITL